jgi:phage terminase large subunit
MQSIDDSVHQLMKDQISALGLDAFYDVQKSAIIGANGTRFSFHGLREQSVHNIKSLEGADRCWVEEAHNVSKRSWDMLIPTIRKEGSEIWVSFNPELETDETYKRFVLSPPPPDLATIVKLNWSDNPWFPETLRREMLLLKDRDPDAYEHVWEGMCKQVVEGAVYRNELLAADKEKRICRVPYEPLRPVDTFWDLGWADNTTIWFAQAVGFEYRLIDYISGSQRSLQSYQKELRERPYVYGTHYLPHDAKAHELGTGKSIEEQMRNAGFTTKVAAKLSIADGIAATRAVFPKCYFDAEKCSDGLQSLRHYRYESDEKLGTLKKEPLHDWASHGADGFRTLAVAIKEQAKPKPKSATTPRQYSPWS